MLTIKAGTMTTVHAYTATQKLQDGPDRLVETLRAACLLLLYHPSFNWCC